MNVHHPPGAGGADRVTTSWASSAWSDVSFTAKAGEILGVAGVAGSGQRELLEAIAGLYPIASGSVPFYSSRRRQTKPSRELVGMDPMAIRKCRRRPWPSCRRTAWAWAWWAPWA